MPVLKESKGYTVIKDMMAAQDRQPFPFQERTWQYIINGESGLVMRQRVVVKLTPLFLVPPNGTSDASER